jgi:integrase
MRKQSNPFAVRMVVLESGERLPMLCARETGVPLFEPTVWALSELRARNVASATIQQALRAVLVLNLVLGQLRIDLDARLSEGRLLELGELEEVTRHCRLPLDEINGGVSDQAAGPAKVVDLEKVRMRTSARAPDSVDDNTAAIRIRYIRDYLKWRSNVWLFKLGAKHKLYAGLEATQKRAIDLLNERTPGSSGRNSVGQREGISEDDLEKLLAVTEPSSPENPWSGDHARERNALIVRWLLSLGLRRGEMLSVRISDINFQTHEVLIARRADSPDDPRKNQPNTKTRDRLIPIDEDLAILTHSYITGARRAIPGARRHEFLIVANGSGAPLTLAALNKIFDVLRRKCPDLPQELCPHVCRHTFNDALSADMDEHDVSPEKEDTIRSHLNGWIPNSGTAATYTRRHVRRQARKVSLGLQEKLMKGNSDEK